MTNRTPRNTYRTIPNLSNADEIADAEALREHEDAESEARMREAARQARRERRH